MSELLEEEFYNLMQTYRHTPITSQGDTIEAYEAVKSHIVWLMKEAFEAGRLEYHKGECFGLKWTSFKHWMESKK